MNTNPSEWRRQCASHLESAAGRAGKLTAFVGLDGFVDEIIQVVDKRADVSSFQPIATISQFAGRIGAAAGRSTNIELVTKLTKLGGNGPIMANALAALGLQVTYVGSLGWPNIHPVFQELAKRADAHSIAEPGHTDALEFNDGKLMLGKHAPLADVDWANLQERFGREKFAGHFQKADLLSFINWTMLPHLSAIWQQMLRDLCPHVTGPRRTFFVDLCDPEKRSRNDLAQALDLIVAFNRYFDVVLGLNEKEAFACAAVLNLAPPPRTVEGVTVLAAELSRRLPVATVVVHAAAFAVSASQGETAGVDGPFTDRPLITTGAGDHFNAGFCLGKLLGLDAAQSLLCAVAASGFYVRTARSPALTELVGFLRNWPTR